MLPRTFYDRQIAWLRQREFDLGDLRRTQLEELTGRKSQGSSRCNSQCTTPRRSPSALVSPRSGVPSDEVVTDCENCAWNESPDRAARSYSRPPAPQRNGTPANRRKSVEGIARTSCPAASARGGRSRSAPSTPRCKSPRAEVGEPHELRSGDAIVSRLRNARQQHQSSLPADAWLCRPSKQSPALWSRTAPLTPKGSQKQEIKSDLDDVRNGQKLAGEQPLHSFGYASFDRLDYTADFGSPSEE